MGLLALAIVIGVGWVGYRLQGLGGIDALFQTVQTVTTVGFNEVGTVDRTYQIFTIALMLVGVGTALYTLGVSLEALLEGRLSADFRRFQMDKEIDRLRGHVIVCGLGQVGSAIVDDLARSGHEVVAVDQREDQAGIPDGVRVLTGDATDDAVLERAGLAHASTLVLAMDADASNVFVALSARRTRPDLLIVARSSRPGSDSKLLQAGADRVINPHAVGGARMAALVDRRNVTDFVDLIHGAVPGGVSLVEVEVGAVAGAGGGRGGAGDVSGGGGGGSRHDHGLTCGEVAKMSGAVVLALRRPDGPLEPNPTADTALHRGDVVIALGTVEEQDRLVEALGS
ncbi:MAG: potassium channel family protein [Acidimicrobiales bacterium]